MDDLISKPSRRYIAHAIPYDGGWLAQYSFPGAVPRFVLSDDGPESAVYDSPDEAESAAALALIAALNGRPRSNQTKERYRLLSGPELANAVRAAGINPTEAQFLLGVSEERFFHWIDETGDKHGRPVPPPPHGVRVLLEIFRLLPESIDIAERLTESVTTQRKPRKEAAE